MIFHDDRELNEPRWTGVREVMAMSWPIILGSLSYTIMEFCDKAMIGYLGKAELGAAGSSSIWAWTMGTFWLGIIGCVSTFVAQSVGRGLKGDCARYAWQGIYLSFGSVVFALVLWPLATPLFASMGHTDEVTQYETTYFKLRLIGYVAMAWMTAMAAFFQAINRQHIPMYAAIVACTFNVFINLFLIYGTDTLGLSGLFYVPRLGVAGAAIGTDIAQFLQAFLLLWVFLGKEMNREYHTRSRMRLDWRRMRELVRIGVPNGANMFLDVANWCIFTSYIVGRFGETALAGHTGALSFMHLSFMPAVAVNQGIAAIVGQWIGRGDIARAKARTYSAIRLVMAYMIGMGAIFAIFGGYLFRYCFSKEPDVIALGHQLLVLAAFFQGFDAINIVTMGALRGAGDTSWVMWVLFFMAYFIFLPMALLASITFGGGALGAWVAATLYITVLSMVLLGRFKGERWRHIRIFEADRVVVPAS